MLNQNAIIIIDVNGNVQREPIGSFRANSNYTSSITVIAPFELDSVVSANYSKKNRKNDDIAQFLIPNGNKKGKDIIGENDPLYQLIYNWHVFEADVDQLAVAYFAKYRSDMLFVSIGVGNIVKPAKATTYKGEFGIDSLLPELADNGDYYISKNYNFMDKNIQWTLNDYAYYDNGWKKSNYRGEAFTEPIELLVDPAIEANYEIQEDLDLSVLLAGRLAIVESRVNVISVQVDNQQLELDNHDTRIETLETKEVALKGRVDTHIEDLNNPHEVTAEQVDTYVKTTIDNKDANTLQQAKDYTYSRVEIDNKDTGIMNKANNLENANMFKDVNYNNVNGVLTFTRYDDTTKAIDLPLELLVESGYYDEVANELVLVLANGSEIRIPVGNLLTDLDAHNIRFNGSGTNYLVAKTEVESAVKELDTRVKANADNVALKVNTSDIVNNLTSTDTNKPLSANQGKVLNDTTAKLAASNVFTQPQQVPNATLPQHAVNKLQVETMFEMFKQQLRGYNLAMPNLSTATDLGGGNYRLYNGNGITIDYNIYNGYHIINGESTADNIVHYINEITMGIEQGLTYYVKYYYLSGSASGGLSWINYRAGTIPEVITLQEVTGKSNLVNYEPSLNKGIRVDFKVGQIYDNLTFKVQVEKGDTATPYTVPGQIPQYKIVGEE